MILDLFDVGFQKSAGFLEMATQDPGRWRVIDADRDADGVFDSVLAAALEVVGRIEG